jgi:Domain of unknown function (DUF4178)
VATEPTQRAYRAPCPGCGAPVEFLSAQSTHAVCGYCQSTVVRSGETLARVGKMAELFDDHSPLQLMASGKAFEQAFTLVGRLQYKSGSGTWTEWNAFLPDGTTASLSEDNGAYVFMRRQDMQREVPAPEHFRVGATTAINGKSFTVASNETAALLSAQGELPKLPPLGQPFAMVELRNEDGEVLSIDYGMQPPEVSIGRAVLLEDLQMTGLRDESAKEEKGARQFHCPNCGAPIEVALESTKSLTCRACNSLIDMSNGIGGELTHVTQDEPVKPLIALGTMGQLQGVHWQVVGFQHRMGTEPGDDEQFGWDEYLLYNRKRGFTFLVDSTEGWSVVKPATGAPKLTKSGQSASYLGKNYELQSTYNAETTYVAGEFYWPVHRGQKTSNRDFALNNSLLSQEQTRTEVTWSVGGKIDSDTVAKAFKLEGKKDLLKRSDAAPLSKSAGMGCGAIIIMFVIIIVLMMLFSRCSACDPAVENCSSSSSSRSSGGSFGGSSGGGGHK